LDVERQRLERAAMAVVGCGEGADGSHGDLRLFARAAAIAASVSLFASGDDQPAAYNARGGGEDGERPAFFDFREEYRPFRGRGKKQAEAVAGRRSRPWPSLGTSQPLEVRVGRAP
jgi:hypothetical protein